MKIIITESQLKLIEAHISEAKNTKLNPKAQAKLGEVILNLSDNLAEGKSIEFILAHGNKVVLKCINEDNNVFTFDVVEDTSNVLKKRTKVSISINPGNGQQGNTAYEYNLNQNSIETTDDGLTFNLIFAGTSKTIKTPAKVKIPNIVSFKETESEPDDKNDDDKNDDDKNDSKDQTTDKPIPSGDTQELNVTGNRAYEMIVNDPLLRKAFYSQPNLWELFLSELQGKESTGRGIISVINILDKYETTRINKILDARFIEGREVILKPIKETTLTYEVNGASYRTIFYPTISYPTIVERKGKFDNYTLKYTDTKKGVSYIFEVLENVNTGNNTFSCNVYEINDKKNKQEIEVVINRKLSKGYQPNK